MLVEDGLVLASLMAIIAAEAECGVGGQQRGEVGKLPVEDLLEAEDLGGAKVDLTDDGDAAGGPGRFGGG